MVGKNMSLKNPVTPPRIDPGTVRPVVQSLKHYATPGPIYIYIYIYIHTYIYTHIIYIYTHTYNIYIYEGKVHPVAGHEGPEGSRDIALLFFNLGARRGGWSSRPGRFTPVKETRYRFIGGWVGPRVRLDGCGKSRPHRDSIPGPSSP